MSCHGKITCSLSASTLPPHFIYIVEAFLFLSECSAPSTPWLQPQLSSVAMPWGAQTPSVWGGSVLQGGVVQWQGSAVLWWHMGWMPVPCPTPASSVQALVPSAACADCPPARFLWELSRGDACRQCSLLSAIAR